MRDDFAHDIKRQLAMRAGHRCSICSSPTSGPQVDPERGLNIGVAAHITAASADGPRFDSSLEADQRRSIANGIWLCQNCAHRIDHDVVQFTVSKLQSLKSAAEQRAHQLLGRMATSSGNELEEVAELAASSPDESQFEAELVGFDTTVPCIEKICSRGHWRVLIRPGGYRARRFTNPFSLSSTLKSLSIKARGLSFPQVRDPEAAPAGLTFSEELHEQAPYLEAWRFTQSGQLLHYAAVAEDWEQPQEAREVPGGWAPGRVLSLGSTLHRVTEILGLAARFASSDTIGDYFDVDMSIVGLRGRKLWVADLSRGQVEGMEAKIRAFPRRWFQPRAAFLAAPRGGGAQDYGGALRILQLRRFRGRVAQLAE